MLILTRRVGEMIKLGDDIDVMVLGIKGNQVRLGIQAPKDLPVHREEIYLKIKAENKLESEIDRDKKPEEEDTVLAILK